MIILTWTEASFFKACSDRRKNEASLKPHLQEPQNFKSLFRGFAWLWKVVRSSDEEESFWSSYQTPSSISHLKANSNKMVITFWNIKSLMWISRCITSACFAGKSYNFNWPPPLWPVTLFIYSYQKSPNDRIRYNGEELFYKWFK